MKIFDDVTDFIFVENTPAKVDVIFMPGGSDPAIPELSTELYRKGYAPLLLPSGRFSMKLGKFAGVKAKADVYNKDYQTECDFYADVLAQNGVPEAAITKEDQSMHTQDNAFLSRAKLDTQGIRIRKAIICCKNFHARRCLMLYQLAFPEAEILVVPATAFGITKDNWHTTEYGIDRVFGELSRCGNQFLPDIKKHLLP